MSVDNEYLPLKFLGRLEGNNLIILLYDDKRCADMI